METVRIILMYIGSAVTLFAALAFLWGLGAWFVRDSMQEEVNRLDREYEQLTWDIIHLRGYIDNLEKYRTMGTDAVPRTCGTDCVPANKQPAAERAAGEGTPVEGRKGNAGVKGRG